MTLDPRIPPPDLIHNEYLSYKKTIFQEHLFGLFFKENYSAAYMDTNLTEEPTLILQKIDSTQSLLIAEVSNLITCSVKTSKKSYSVLGGTHFLILFALILAVLLLKVILIILQNLLLFSYLLFY